MSFFSFWGNLFHSGSDQNMHYNLYNILCKELYMLATKTSPSLAQDPQVYSSWSLEPILSRQLSEGSSKAVDFGDPTPGSFLAALAKLLNLSEFHYFI